MRDYSYTYKIQQDLKKLRHELSILSAEPSSDSQKQMEIIKSDIQKLEDYYTRNKDRIKKHDCQGLQTLAKERASGSLSAKYNRCNNLIRSRSSMLNILIAKFKYLKAKAVSGSEIQETRDRILKCQSVLNSLRRWRKDYLSNLKPSEVRSSFELEVYKKEFERRLKEKRKDEGVINSPG